MRDEKFESHFLRKLLDLTSFSASSSLRVSDH